MKRFYVVCLAVVLLFTCSFTLNKDAERINWNKNTKLSWEDFKGKPSRASSNDAMTDSGFGFQTLPMKNDSLVIIISSYFNPGTSWVKMDKATDALLAHEQCHFDITELFARKLKKLFAKTKFNRKTIMNEVKNMDKKVVDDWQDFQDKYDKETEHSKKEKKQLDWEKKIAKDLEETAEYINDTLKVYVK